MKTDTNAQKAIGNRTWQDVVDPTKRADVPEGLWMRCPNCEAMSYRKQVQQNLYVCPDCDYHYRIGADQRIEQICDPGSFEAMWTDLAPKDVLNFVDRKPYKDRMDSRFMMASMGSVVGEKITRTVELAIDTDRPMIIVNASGGARMQESALSLAQMSKVSAALARLDDAGGLYVSVLTDPTYGGVTASFAMLGDLIVAEPRAYIGFAGARVIANTVRQELPEGFQRSEHLVEKGFIDRVIHRRDLRSEISRFIDYAGK